MMQPQQQKEQCLSIVLSQKYHLVSKIGQGSFGTIYLAKDVQNPKDKKLFAVKVQPITSQEKLSNLLHEVSMIETFSEEAQGFPAIYTYGTSARNKCVYAVIDLLGPNIEELFNLCGKKFSLKTSLMLWYQILERLETMHSRGYKHADIKPENLLMGLKSTSNTVHMIDFGLTHSVIDKDTQKHVPFTLRMGLSGTSRYVSMNAHNRYALSRRDDLISVAYMVVRFITGSLPWEKIRTRPRSPFDREIGLSKQQYHWRNNLCSRCPMQVQQYMNYVTSLEFEELADFDHMKNLVKRAAVEANLDIFDNIFDWCIFVDQKQSKFDHAVCLRSEADRRRDQQNFVFRNHKHVKQLLQSNFGSRIQQDFRSIQDKRIKAQPEIGAQSEIGNNSNNAASIEAQFLQQYKRYERGKKNIQEIVPIGRRGYSAMIKQNNFRQPFEEEKKISMPMQDRKGCYSRLREQNCYYSRLREQNCCLLGVRPKKYSERNLYVHNHVQSRPSIALEQEFKNREIAVMDQQQLDANNQPKDPPNCSQPSRNLKSQSLNTINQISGMKEGQVRLGDQKKKKAASDQLLQPKKSKAFILHSGIEERKVEQHQEAELQIEEIIVADNGARLVAENPPQIKNENIVINFVEQPDNNRLLPQKQNLIVEEEQIKPKVKPTNKTDSIKQTIRRLSFMQGILTQGNEVNQAKLDKNMMGEATYTEQKQNHRMFLAQHFQSLELNNDKIAKVLENRSLILGLVPQMNESELLQKPVKPLQTHSLHEENEPCSNDIGFRVIKLTEKSLPDQRNSKILENKNQRKNKNNNQLFLFEKRNLSLLDVSVKDEIIPQDQQDLNQLEKLSDCSVEVPTERDFDQIKEQPEEYCKNEENKCNDQNAAAYRPKKYSQKYQRSEQIFKQKQKQVRKN